MRRAALAALFGVAAACGHAKDPIIVAGGAISIENQTSEDWKNVEVWINDHFRGSADSLPAHGRLRAPLNSFVAGFDQRFDRTRQSVFGVEVTARTASGRPVRLVWGSGRRQ